MGIHDLTDIICTLSPCACGPQIMLGCVCQTTQKTISKNELFGPVLLQEISIILHILVCGGITFCPHQKSHYGPKQVKIWESHRLIGPKNSIFEVVMVALQFLETNSIL